MDPKNTKYVRMRKHWNSSVPIVGAVENTMGVIITVQRELPYGQAF
jgi:hypothetical protein